jgi:hypothetical protein
MLESEGVSESETESELDIFEDFPNLPQELGNIV